MMEKLSHENGLVEHKSRSRIDWLAAFVIFIIPLISIVISGKDLSRWMMNILPIIYLGCIICTLVLAINRGLPRWSLSYLGFLLTILVFYGLLWILWGLLFYIPWMLIFGPMDSWPLLVRLLYQGAMTTFMWFLVLFAAIILINLLKHWSYTRYLWRHIREDWTQLSYLVYGGIVFYIWYIFDEYQYENAWTFAAYTSLAIGGWLHLRARKQYKRYLALIAGTTGAMWIIAIGKWVIIPIQNWPVNLESERWFEATRTIGGWIVTLAALTTPALLNLLPQFSNPIDEEVITSA